MITTNDLESLGWNVRATSRKGASKSFSKKGHYTIFGWKVRAADNFIMQNSPEFEVIVINKVESGKSVEIWKGIPIDIQDLKRILVETGADMEWLPELRDEKINDILNER